MKAEAGKIYRHYGGNIYRVIGIALEEATLTEVVVYREICPYQVVEGTGKVWTRPREQFEGQVNIGSFMMDNKDGVLSIDRFTKVETVEDWMRIVNELKRERDYEREKGEKFADQVKLTCRRAEKAEAELEKIKEEKKAKYTRKLPKAPETIL